MDDLISRQAAIDALMAWEEDSFCDEECLKHRGEPFWVSPSDVIEQLPPAQPEQKTGKWIDAVLPNDNGGLPVQVCDQCNTFFPLAYTGGGHRFCPSCGAKMEVEHE